MSGYVSYRVKAALSALYKLYGGTVSPIGSTPPVGNLIPSGVLGGAISCYLNPTLSFLDWKSLIATCSGKANCQSVTMFSIVPSDLGLPAESSNIVYCFEIYGIQYPLLSGFSTVPAVINQPCLGTAIIGEEAYCRG